MVSGHTNLQATDPDGRKLSVQHTSTDSPILPAGNLFVLQQIDPKLVEWVVRETEKEANHRRSETTKINWFIFIERLSGVIAGAGVSIIGLGFAAYLVLQGHDWAGVAIGGGTLATIISILVSHNKKSETPPQPNPTKKSGKKN